MYTCVSYVLVTGIDVVSISTVFRLDFETALAVGWGSWKIFSFLCSVLYTIVCPIIYFLLTIALPVLFRFTASDYSFGTVKLFLFFILSCMCYLSKLFSFIFQWCKWIRSTSLATIRYINTTICIDRSECYYRNQTLWRQNTVLASSNDTTQRWNVGIK